MNTSKKIMIIVGIALIVGFFAIVISGMGANKKVLAFDSLDSQLVLLDKTYEKWFPNKIDVRSQEAGQRVLCDWFNYKAGAASAVDGISELGEQFKADLMDLVMATSIDSEFYASEAAFEDLFAVYSGDEAKRTELIQKCSEMAPELEKHIDDEIRMFRDLATVEGLSDAQNHIIPEKKNIVRLLHRHQWVVLASGQLPRNRIESPEEALAVLRWQIEQSTMSTIDKLKRLDLARLDGLDYDYSFAEGVLFFQDQRFDDACSVLKDALASLPPDKEFRRIRYTDGMKEISRAGSRPCQ